MFRSLNELTLLCRYTMLVALRSFNLKTYVVNINHIQVTLRITDYRNVYNIQSYVLFRSYLMRSIYGQNNWNFIFIIEMTFRHIREHRVLTASRHTVNWTFLDVTDRKFMSASYHNYYACCYGINMQACCSLNYKVPYSFMILRRRYSRSKRVYIWDSLLVITLVFEYIGIYRAVLVINLFIRIA